MTDDQVNEFLEHYGVAGMRWGVRKQSGATRRESNRQARRQRFAEGKATQRDKLISDLDLDRSRAERKAGVAPPTPARGARTNEMSTRQKVALGLVAGGAIAYMVLSARGGTKVKSMPKIELNKDRDLSSLFAMSRKVKMSDIKNAPKPPGGPKISKSTSDWIKAFNAKQTVLNRAANADMKKWDNASQVPYNMRKYLPDWD